MKRSEMLKIIDDVLKDKDNDIYQYGEFCKLAPKILDLIEEEGMLPPLVHKSREIETEYPFEAPSIFASYIDKSTEWYYSAEWEDET